MQENDFEIFVNNSYKMKIITVFHLLLIKTQINDYFNIFILSEVVLPLKNIVHETLKYVVLFYLLCVNTNPSKGTVFKKLLIFSLINLLYNVMARHLSSEVTLHPI